MLIYSGSKKQFDTDILANSIADKIRINMHRHGVFVENEREQISYKNSLTHMQKVLDNPYFSDDLQIAVEYQIPQTSKGLEFDYIGVIIGKDLRFENGRVITDVKQRAKSDQSLKGIKNDPRYRDKVDKIIRNTYKTLLTRGQKGCYIYCEDHNLQKYLKEKLERRGNTR